MTQNALESFNSLAPLLMPKLIDLNRLDAIDDYGEYALLTFSLAKPLGIEEVMNIMEDQMELTVLYHTIASDATDAGQHCCTYSNPSFSHMYKFNAQTMASGKVETVYVYIYESLEDMLEALKSDMEQHSHFANFKAKVEMAQLIADFM